MDGITYDCFLLGPRLFCRGELIVSGMVIFGSLRKPHPIFFPTQVDQLFARQGLFFFQSGNYLKLEIPAPPIGWKNWFLLRFQKVFVTERIWKFLSGCVLFWQRSQIVLKGSMIAKWMRNNCSGTQENPLRSWPWLNNILASGFERLRPIPQEP